MTGRAKEVRAIRRHLRDLLVHKAVLAKAIAHLEESQRAEGARLQRPRRSGATVANLKPAH